MAVWKILGQDASTSTGSTGQAVVYTNATTNGVVGWGVVSNRTTASILVDVFVSTSTASADTNNIVHYRVPKENSLETPRFTMSTGDSVVWYQATTGLTVNIFGSEGISTA